MLVISVNHPIPGNFILNVLLYIVRFETFYYELCFYVDGIRSQYKNNDCRATSTGNLSCGRSQLLSTAARQY